MTRSQVLVVDDDAGFRALARRVLEEGGLAVVGEAGTGAEAWDAVRALRPAAVLLDVHLPDDDGIRLGAAIAGLPWHPRVVLISSDPAAAVSADGTLPFVPKADLPSAPIAAMLGGPEA